MHARVASERFDAVFSITGAFDPIAASRFRDRLAELPPDACVLFDFSHAWEVADLALAVLATAVVRTHHPRVLLRGLTQHQERMLRYLGVDHVILGAPAPDDRPEWVGEA